MWRLLLGLVGPLAYEPPTSTPPVPPAALVDDPQPRHAGMPEILYVNFDGGVLLDGCGNEAHYNCSTLASLFDGYVGPFPGNETQRISILQATRETLADFGVRVVVDRPPDDVDYTMVMYGDLGAQDFAGIAPYIDCEDIHRNDTSFTGAFDTSNTGSTVILQEAAHTWGLEHVDNEFDVLNPFKSSGIHQTFTDECHRIVANTSLQPTPGSCNQIHTMFCESGFQNSWQEMRWLFGPPIPDTTPPELEILSPLPDEVFVLPATIPLLGEITDDLDPQFYHVEIYFGEQVVYDSDNIKLELLIENPDPGEIELRIVITDEAGNQDEETIAFEILPEGSELPAEDELVLEDLPSEGCSTAADRTEYAHLLALVAVLGLRRRRR
jgi:hypothetical protein